MWKQILMAAPPREKMMMRLAGEVGMRRAEVACCHRDDLIEDLCGWSLIIHGKGNKQRMIPIHNRLARDIMDFCGHGYLFPGQDNGHLAAMTVGKLVGDLMPPGWSMHKLRHRFATRSLAAGGDLLVVRDLLGHTSVATTQLYTASVPEKMRRITDLLAQED
jgi:site-specific recombinase XerD